MGILDYELEMITGKLRDAIADIDQKMSEYEKLYNELRPERKRLAAILVAIEGRAAASDVTGLPVSVPSGEVHACDECSRRFQTLHGLHMHTARTHKKTARELARSSVFPEDLIGGRELAPSGREMVKVQVLRCTEPGCHFECDLEKVTHLASHTQGRHKRMPTRVERMPTSRRVSA